MRLVYLLRVIFLCSLAIFSSLIAVAQNSTPKHSNEFLAIGVGARAMGMSNSQVAISEDVTSGYWNPAGLLEIEAKHEFSLMHAEYFAGIAKFDYAAYATPVDSLSHIGVSLIRFGIDDIPDTRFLYDANGALNYDNIRFFSAADYAMIFSYARKIPKLKGLKLGANFKIVHRKAGDFANAWGFGLDAGAQYGIRNWKFGLMVKDITGTFNAWTHNTELLIDIFTQTGNEIPDNSIEVTLPTAILGVAYQQRLANDKIGIAASTDLAMTFDGKRNVLIQSDAISIDPRIGLELDYLEIGYLRMGVGNFQDIKNFNGTTDLTFQPNIGAGVRIKKIMIDYALTDIGDQSESLYSNVFSVTVSLD